MPWHKMVRGRVVEKRSEISNLDLKKDIDRIIKLEEIFYPFWNNGLSSRLSNVLRPSSEAVKEGRILLPDKMS